jgi:hypothetical protein
MQEAIMTAKELAGDFSKKIGKPIPFAHLERSAEGMPPLETNYVVEPVAVTDAILQALVTLKELSMSGHKLPPKRSLVNREIEIPLEDGDTATLVLTMAVAGVDLENYPEKVRKTKAYTAPTSCCRTGSTSLRKSRRGRGCNPFNFNDLLKLVFKDSN